MVETLDDVDFFSEIRCVLPSSEFLITEACTYCFNFSFKFNDNVWEFRGETLRFELLPLLDFFLSLSSYWISRVIAVNFYLFVTFSRNVVFLPKLVTELYLPSMGGGTSILR